MKKYKTINKSKNRIVAGIIFGFLILMSVVPAMAEEPNITLNPIQPTTAGSIEQISWSYIGVFEPNVTLELFKDGILDRTIISDTFIGNVSYYNGTTPYGNGSYNWAIPILLEAGTYQIKIISKTTTGLELTNTTDIEITTPTEQGCRYCHSSGIPDRHHVLDYYGEYECTNCHPVVLNNGSYETLMDRNCIDCHYGTPFWANPLINPGEPHLNPNLIVTNPNGDSWEIGTAHTIRWNYTGNVGPNAKIELLKNGTLIQTIRPDSFFGHSYENSYNWTIPEVETGPYQIKVTMSNVNGSAVYANTSDIEIATPTEQGCRTCHSSDIPDRHHVLDYYGEYECTNCHPVVLNNGSYETLMDRNCIDCHYGTPFWANPLINPGKPHLNPNLIVTNPNGDSWEVGTAHTIRWNYTGNVGPNAKIELLKNGTLIQTIRPDSFFGHSYENSYNWTVPEVETGSYQTKVTMSNVNGSAVYANTSDVYIQLPSITVTSPITGDNWVRGTTETIRWTYTGDLGNYATIELLEQGIVSQTWNNVSQSSGAGSYDWAIPSNFKVSTYQIRVSAGGYSNTTGNFNIVKR